MSTKPKHAIALYGSVALERGQCPKCHGISIVRDGLYICCDAPVTGSAQILVRESMPPQHRKTPSRNEKVRILTEQNNRCIYCGVEFNTYHWRHTKRILVRLNWDHRMPYKYSQNNTSSNFVAACHVCNGIKSDKVFTSLEETKAHIAARRLQKGWDF